MTCASGRGTIVCTSSMQASPTNPFYVQEDVVVVSEGLPLHLDPKWLGVSSALSHSSKCLFLLSNIPYYVVAWLIASAPAIPTDCSWHCLTGMCHSPAFLGAIILSLGMVSSYWHGAQCELMLSIYCPERDTGIPRLHSARWQKRLITGDIACSILTFLMGVCCFGVVRTVSWIAPGVILFVTGAFAKRSARYKQYALLHGLWHVASALAIYNIVLTATALSEYPSYFT